MTQARPNPENTEAVVIGVGTRHRGDDAAGLAVAQLLRREHCAARICERDGEPLGLMETWRDAPLAIVIDAAGGDRPGRLHRFDATDAPLPAVHRGSSSTHGLGLAEAVELARALNQLPHRLIVFGIEGATFERGAAMSPAVAAAVPAAAAAVQQELVAREPTRTT